MVHAATYCTFKNAYWPVMSVHLSVCSSIYPYSRLFICRPKLINSLGLVYFWNLYAKIVPHHLNLNTASSFIVLSLRIPSLACHFFAFYLTSSG